jgi:hypothetical protein
VIEVSSTAEFAVLDAKTASPFADFVPNTSTIDFERFWNRTQVTWYRSAALAGKNEFDRELSVHDNETYYLHVVKKSHQPRYVWRRQH